MAITDPCGRHPFAASGAVMVGEDHAPLWQYFSRVRERKGQTSPLPPPKGTDIRPPRPFPLQTSRFQGTIGRGHNRDLGPLGATTQLSGLGAKAMPPLSQYLFVCE